MMVLVAIALVLLCFGVCLWWLGTPPEGESRTALAREEAQRQLQALNATGPDMDDRERTRAEAAIKRRLLAQADDRVAQTRTGLLLPGAFLLIVLAGSMAAYLNLGKPAQQDTAHVRPQDPSLETKLAELEGLLDAEPDQADGWALLGRSAAGLKQYQRAAEAYGKAADAAPDRADYRISQGEMLMQVANGLVSPAALLVFDKADKAAPGHPAVAYYRGLGRLQKGRRGQAADIWQAAMDALPEGAQDREVFRMSLARLQQESQRQQIAQLPADQQREMIESMVAGLAARLEENPDDIAGWTRLARAYEVLERPAEALRAYERLLSLVPENQTAPLLAQIERLRAAGPVN